MHRAPWRGRRKNHTHGADQTRADRKIKYGAFLWLTHFAQCSHLHIGQRRTHAREQPDKPGKQLVVVDGGAQSHDHAYKAHQYRQHQRPLFLRLAIEQRAAQNKGCEPHPTHVIERHGGGYGQMGDGVKPGTQRQHADGTAGQVHHGHRRAQTSAPGAHHHSHKDDADQTAVKNNLENGEAVGG